MDQVDHDIRRLDEPVIDQIAAGEVIERPASVVKELVENAIDAGATRIVVEVEGGGRRLVRVIDDGAGMSPDEARLSVERHATSKLRRVEDLTGIGTMGFRGEALAAIASVSRFSLTSRPRRQAERPGWRIVIEGGERLSEGEHGAPIGTQIEVRDLLFNLPARLKFMKGEATETAHVTEAVTRLAMAHPHIHFRLSKGGRTVLDVSPTTDDLERVDALVSSRLAAKLCPARGRGGGVSVRAFLAPPELAQTTARAMHFFVGRRWVRDRGLVHAVLSGYGELVPRGRYPAAVVFLEVDGAIVDVNVHPQKLEVRFADAQAVYAAVRHGVRDAVAQAPWLSAQVGAWAPIGHTSSRAASASTLGGGGGGVWSSPPARTTEVARDSVREYARSLNRSLFNWRAESQSAAIRVPATAEGSQGNSLALPAACPEPIDQAELGSDETDGFFSGLRFLGQLDRTYLVCERQGEMVLIDQHAAHERVAFQQIKARHMDRCVARQRLLFPRTITLSGPVAAVAVEVAEALDAIGFEIEPFGAGEGSGAQFAVKAVPAELRAGEDPEALLMEILEELAAGHSAGPDTSTPRGPRDTDWSRALESRLDNVFATLACHSVVRAGDTLAAAEVESLLRSLDEVDFAAHCPHGRPVLLRLRVDEIARRLGRT